MKISVVIYIISYMIAYIIFYILFVIHIISYIIFILHDPGEQDKEEIIEVCADDFYSALDHLVPSVSEQELQHYKYLKKTLTAGK